eukprot:COSAG01_NODE_17567_length_1140_cov_0.471662_3_plen_29_part_01
MRKARGKRHGMCGLRKPAARNQGRPVRWL